MKQYLPLLITLISVGLLFVFFRDGLIQGLASLIFIGAVTLDFFLSYDQWRNNSIREQLLNITQGSWGWLAGSAVPYAIGLLTGHFYHLPGMTPLLQLPWLANLGVVIAIGFFISIGSRKLGFPRSNMLLGIAIFGALVGAVLWPVPMPGPN